MENRKEIFKMAVNDKMTGGVLWSNSDVTFTITGSSTKLFAKSEIPSPKNVVYNGRTTIVFFSDDTKVIVRCGNMDEYDRDAAVAQAIMAKLFGSKSKFKKFVAGGHEQMSVADEDIRSAAKQKKKLDRDSDFPF